VVRSQIVNLIPDPSFGHNLCFKCQSGSCELILEIQGPRDFQWYKEILNLMNFDPCNCFLKIWKSIGTPIPKVGAHLGVWGFIPSHSPTLLEAWNVNPRLPFRLAALQALALVVSPRLRLQHWTYCVCWTCSIHCRAYTTCSCSYRIIPTCSTYSWTYINGKPIIF